jgi:hypothetical protein
MTTIPMTPWNNMPAATPTALSTTRPTTLMTVIFPGSLCFLCLRMETATGASVVLREFDDLQLTRIFIFDVGVVK